MVASEKGMVAVGIGVGDDPGDGMQCPDHPYRANPGGICAFCLQEKLGKLVSSSKSSTPFPPARYQKHHSPSSYSPPSFRSSAASGIDARHGGGAGLFGGRGGLSSLRAAATTSSSSTAAAADSSSGSQWSRIPAFLYGHKKKKTTSGGGGSSSSSNRKVTTSSGATTRAMATKSNHDSNSPSLATLKRSKSVVARRPTMDHNQDSTSPATTLGDSTPMDSPRKRWFWSFLRHSSHGNQTSSGEKDPIKYNHRPQSSIKLSSRFSSASNVRVPSSEEAAAGAATTTTVSTKNRREIHAAEEASPRPPRPLPNGETPASSLGFGREETERSPSCASQALSASFGRKVARSRSVGCGSRSFSGDFLDRISTGLGDCTLRRVESQREALAAANGGSKIVLHRLSVSGAAMGGVDDDDERHGQQRTRCGGIFGGFGMHPTSASSSSYWLPEELGSGRTSTTGGGGGGCNSSSRGTTPRARMRGWGWAFASPIRAFRPSSTKPQAVGAESEKEYDAATPAKPEALLSKREDTVGSNSRATAGGVDASSLAVAVGG